MSDQWTAEQQSQHMCSVVRDGAGVEILDVRGGEDYGKALADQIVHDHNQAAAVRRIGLKLDTLADIARAISSDAGTLESALRRFDHIAALEDARR